MSEYTVVNGTSYHIDTPKLVIDVLEQARQSGRRIRLYYGDVETGRSWGDEYDIIGKIGRSCGSIKVPLMIYSRRSMGGLAFLDHCIVKAVDVASKRVLYQHPSFNQPEYTLGAMPENIGDMTGYTAFVYAGGQNVANFKSHDAAHRWIGFMTGQRMSK